MMTPILAVTDSVWLALIAAVLAMYMEWARRKTAVQVDAVKKDLKFSDEKNGKKMDAIHDAVNGNVTINLSLASVALRRVADLTNSPKDIAAAEMAEKHLADHERERAKNRS